ncbi:Uncharacterised protein [Candidatus Gugararchaeum adminiculabundum]|nr:Uncharacterised protein [Candidatus Gugararchaeum adminiculabundum]
MDSDTAIMIAGAGIGILAALIGVYVALRALGYFEYLGGSKIPPGKKPIPKKELLAKLGVLSNPANPFKITPSQKSDFEIDWEIVNEKWLLGTSWLNKRYHAWLYADDERKTVRICEMISERSAGFTGAGFGFHAYSFQGVQLFQKERGVLWSIGKDRKLEKIYDYSFNPMDVKFLIKQIANQNGWEYVQVVTPKHAQKKT